MVPVSPVTTSFVAAAHLPQKTRPLAKPDKFRTAQEIRNESDADAFVPEQVATSDEAEAIADRPAHHDEKKKKRQPHAEDATGDDEETSSHLDLTA
jgi:hypothetical protein